MNWLILCSATLLLGKFGNMLKKSTLEKVISEDLAEIWAVLEPEEKRRVLDNFVIHNFKKN